MIKIVQFFQSRVFHFAFLPAIIIGWFLYTDPSNGADTMLRVQLWAQALLITGVSYAITKSLTGSASSEKLYDQALVGNTAAGLAYVGMCLLRASVLFGLLIFFAMVQK